MTSSPSVPDAHAVPSLVQCLRAFCENTSVKAVPRAAKAPRLSLVLLWTVAAVALIFVAVYTTTYILMDFYLYPVVVEYKEYSLLDNLPDATARYIRAFPAVTVCNINPLAAGEAANRSVASWKEYRRLLMTKLRANESFRFHDDSTKNDILGRKGYFRYLGPDMAAKLGHRAETFIKSCHFIVAPFAKEVPCASLGTVRVEVWDTYYNCFTVRLDNSERPARGMRLVLYLGAAALPQDTLLHAEEQETGAVMVIHDSDTFPDMQHDRIWLSPGHHFRVRVKPEIRTRLERPHGQCMNMDSERMRSWQNNSYKYSQWACLLRCWGALVKSNCGCKDSVALQVMERGDYNEQSQFCGQVTWDSDLGQVERSLQCAANYSTSMYRLCHRDCPIECEEIKYESAVSFSRWPAASSRLAVYKSLIHGTRLQQHFAAYTRLQQDITTGNKTNAFQKLAPLEAIDENFIKITVTGNRDEVSHLKDKKKETIFSLFSQVGGTLNLWAGITVVLLVEILEFLINIFSLCVRRCSFNRWSHPTSGSKPTSHSGPDQDSIAM